MDRLRKVLEELNRIGVINVDINIALNKFEAYMDGILESNKNINLTSIENRNDFILRHFIDSITAAGFISSENIKKIVDIGTGAGFPGIPLAIIFPEKEFLLVDSLKKRLNVIDRLSDSININNIETCHLRAEDLGRDIRYREKFDVCVSRAVSSLETLSEYCLPLVKKGGIFIAYKGPKMEEEKIRSMKAIKMLGGELTEEFIPSFEQFKEFEHRLLIIKKIRNTPAQYPRKAGIPSREPLI